MELPDDGRAQDELWFSNMLSGILRGALEMVSEDEVAIGHRVLSSAMSAPPATAQGQHCCIR